MPCHNHQPVPCREFETEALYVQGASPVQAPILAKVRLDTYLDGLGCPACGSFDPIPSPLALLVQAREQLQNAEKRHRDLVVKAHAKGYSWNEIGSALGVSRQAAWERFGSDAR